jgi:hypothetical protein
MSKLKEIETAIAQLSPNEFSELARWVQELDQKRWDEQLDSDASAGKLDFLIKEAKSTEDGFPKDWP